MMKRLFYILLLFAACATTFAQTTDRDYLRMGNRHFHKGDYNKASTNYSKAKDRKVTAEALYNFGCASLFLGNDSLALASFMQADSVGFTNQLKRAKNFHNIGNMWYLNGVQHLKQNNAEEASKSFQNAVVFFKSSLRCNPKDDETRYNLAMALHQLKKNQNNKGGGGDSKDDKNKDKDQKNQDKKDQQKKQDNKSDQQDQNQPQPQSQKDKDQMSDQAAEQLLNSAQRDEERMQNKLKVNPQRRRALEKDW